MASRKKSTSRKAPRKKPVQRRRRTPEELIADLESEIEMLRKRIAARKARKARKRSPAAPKGPRFSPRWLASHREKLELSAADYGALVGVTAQTIYKWEKGGARPRARQLDALAAVRSLGKREAWRRLSEMEA